MDIEDKLEHIKKILETPYEDLAELADLVEDESNPVQSPESEAERVGYSGLGA
jgi:hypothetical protein